MNLSRLSLIRSNSQARLLTALIQRIKHDFGGKLFEPVTIIVRNSGIRRYLVQSLADRMGIAANVNFYYPENLTSLFSSEHADASDDISSIFTFAVFELLRDKEFYGEFIGAGAGNTQPTEIQTYKMAERISRLLLNSMHYNPEPFLTGRFHNKNARRLWNRIVKNKQFRFAHECYLSLKDQSFQNLPGTTYIFGIPFLTGFELLMVSLLSRHSDIHYFQQTPSGEYWFDYPKKTPVSKGSSPEMDAAAASKNRKTDTTGAFPVQNEFFSNHGDKTVVDGINGNHDFLNYFGKAQRVFERQLMDRGVYDTSSDVFDDSPADSILSSIRQAMWTNKNSSGFRQPPDRSFRVHACPTIFREVEIVYNEILDVLHSGVALPADILVTAPNISVYTAAINDVFRKNPENIPYFLTERVEFIHSELYLFFECVFKHLVHGISTELLKTMMGFELIREKFNIASDELATVNLWLDTLPLYKKNAADRSVDEDLEANASVGDTAGFWDRLFYGYVFEQQGTFLYRGVLPYPQLRGLDHQVLGKLYLVTHHLERVWKAVGSSDNAIDKKRTVSEWSRFLDTVFDVFVDEIPKTDRSHFNDIGVRMKKMSRKTQSILFDRNVFWQFFSQMGREYNRLSRSASTDGICISSMLNARGIPFKAVYAMGLNHDDFPGNEGDKNDYFFDRSFYPEPDIREHRLYSIISLFLNAGRRLHMSYIGYDYDRNFEIPLPVHIQFIVTHLNTHYASVGDTAAPQKAIKAEGETQFLIKHPLHSFHRRYFANNPDMFSYSKAVHTLGTAVYSRNAAHRFPNDADCSRRDKFCGATPESRAGDYVYVEDLYRFFTHPIRYFCQTTLKIWDVFPEPALVHSEYKPITVNYDHKNLIERIMPRTASIEKTEMNHIKRVLRAVGNFPEQCLGEFYLNEIIADIRKITTLVPESVMRKTDREAIHIVADDGIVAGSVAVCGGTLFEITVHAIRYRTLIYFYLNHVLLNASGFFRPSYLLGSIKHGSREHIVLFELPTPDNAANSLSELLKRYLAGPHAPLCIFPHRATAAMNGQIIKKLTGKETADTDLDAILDKSEAGIPKTGDRVSDRDYDFNDFYIRSLYTEEHALPITFKDDFKALCLPLLSALTVYKHEDVAQKIRRIFNTD